MHDAWFTARTGNLIRSACNSYRGSVLIVSYIRGILKDKVMSRRGAEPLNWAGYFSLGVQTRYQQNFDHQQTVRAQVRST